MTIQEALVSLVLADPTVTGLIGQKLYPQQAPQSTAFPLALYATDDPIQTMNVAGIFMNQFWSNFRWDCYGGGDTKYSSATAIAAAIRGVLYGFIQRTPFRLIGTGPGSIYVQGIFANGGEDGLEPPVHAEEHGLDYVGVQIRVCFSIN